MDHLMASTSITPHTTEALRERLDEVGSIFEFVTMALDRDASVGESEHRRALSKLYEQIMDSQRAWHRKVIRKLPAAEYPEPSMKWNLDKAVGHVLSRQQILSLFQMEAESPDSPTLFDDFRSPLCLEMCGVGAREIQLLFREWADMIGFVDQDDVVVFNWGNLNWQHSLKASGKPITEPTWTDFFCSDSKQQHTWCLTIWNPVRCTMAALAACSTA